jgi:heme oxygenase
MSRKLTWNRGKAGRAHLELREVGRSTHSLLDERWDRASLASRDGYTKFLQLNWPCVSIEIALEAAGIHRLLPDWDRRRRRNALIDDFKRLGMIQPETTELKIVRDDDGTLLGWCYVLEGSRLGGSLVKNLIKSTGNGTLDTATSFISHGIECDYWRSFKEALACIDNEEAAIIRACEGADACFKCFLCATT